MLERVKDLDATRRDSELFRTFWNKLLLLLRHAWGHDRRQSGQRSYQKTTTTTREVGILHLAANVAWSVPESLQEGIFACCVARAGGDETTATDAFLPPPLHVAIAAASTTMATTASTSSLVRQQQRRQLNSFLRKVLEVQPEAAAIPFRLDTNTHRSFCQSTLARAIAEGMHFHEYVCVEDDGDDNQSDDGRQRLLRVEDGPVMFLVRAAPDLMLAEQWGGRLAAFLLAAVVAEERGGEGRAWRSTCRDKMIRNRCWHQQQVDTIYNLLRLHPEQLQESRQTQFPQKLRRRGSK